MVSSLYPHCVAHAHSLLLGSMMRDWCCDRVLPRHALSESARSRLYPELHNSRSRLTDLHPNQSLLHKRKHTLVILLCPRLGSFGCVVVVVVVVEVLL